MSPGERNVDELLLEIMLLKSYHFNCFGRNCLIYEYFCRI